MNTRALPVAQFGRIQRLVDLCSRGGSVLDVGAREGWVSQRLVGQFGRVVALDLNTPQFADPGVHCMAGDVRALAFPDRSFDVVVCSEVLEHVPELERACAEIARVAADAIVIGVPYRQDRRIGRLRCNHCGKNNPPYGHVHSFDERRLAGLFPGWVMGNPVYEGQSRDVTNWLAAWLMDRGGNPWGTYHQSEPCIYCGKRMERVRPNLWMHCCSAVAGRINRVQRALTTPRPWWIMARWERR